MTDETNESKEKNVFQRISRKIADGIKKLIFFIFFNPLVMVTLGFIVGGRLYEGGFLSIKGTTVYVSGVCETSTGLIRDDLVQDQVVIASIDDEKFQGMIRKTRESIICSHDKTTIDRFGPLDDFLKPKIEIPEIKKLDKKTAQVKDYSQYENKKLLISGLCSNAKTNERLSPFRDKVVDVTNISNSDLDPSIVYFTGIREDDIPVVCNVKDINYDFYEEDRTFKKEEEDVTYRGKTVFVTGLCFPDKAVYDKIGKKDYLPYYDMQKIPVEVTEDKYSKKEKKIVALRGSILDKTLYNQKSIFGHKVVCDDKDSPMNVTTDSSIEQFNPTLQKKDSK